MGGKKKKKSTHNKKKSVNAKKIVTTTETEFPFFTSDFTVKHVKRSKVMFIMRGLPGSGKSTLVRLIAARYKPRVTVCSADDYHLQDDGTYQFDPDKIKEAHGACQQKATDACENNKGIVVIDNTNVRRWETGFYVSLASRCSYTVVMVQPKTAWRFDPQELAQKNKHGVPLDALMRKVDQFDEVPPLYYGWFVNEAGSNSLQRKVQQYFHSCITHIPKFAECLQSTLGIKDITSQDFSKIYTREDSSTSTVHCTTYFSSRGRDPDHRQYADSHDVQRSLGQAFMLTVIGFVITTRTVGARLRLNPRQLQLWSKDDNETSRPQRIVSSAMSYSAAATKQPSPQSYSEDDEEGVAQKRPRFQPTVGLGSRAHITLGYTEGNKAVQTGLDLIDAVRCEQKASSSSSCTEVEVRGATVRYYGQQGCVVYLDEPLRVSSLFSGRY